MCKGFSIKQQKHDLQEWRRIRSISWTVLCGYADPKKLPASQTEWWPIEGDQVHAPVKSRKMTKRQINRLAAAIKRELEKGDR